MAVQGARQATPNCRHERSSLVGLCSGHPAFVFAWDGWASWRGLRIVANWMFIRHGFCAACVARSNAAGPSGNPSRRIKLLPV